MKCIVGNESHLARLWSNTDSKTYSYFENLISCHQVTLIMIEDEINNDLIGELYLFWDSVDKDEADGCNRAYLCALRVKEEYRGKGLSSLLVSKAKELAEARNYSELSIGIDNSNYQTLSKIYAKWGFVELIKETDVDNHFITKEGKPLKLDECYQLRLCSI